MSGAYEREAIRPHALGRFADMLLAVESHPAMLFYLDNALDGPELDRRHQSQPRPQRELRARDHGAAYARRAHRLHPGRRHQLRQGAHRLDAGAARRQSRARRRVHVQSRGCTSPARRPCSASATSRRTRAGPRRAARPRRASGDRDPRRDQARAPFRRRRAAAGSGRAAGEDASATPTAISSRSRARWSPSPEAWASRGPNSSARANGSLAWCARPASPRSTRSAFTAGAGAARRTAVAAAGAQGLFRRRGAWIDGIGRRLDIANNFAERVAATLDPQAIIDGRARAPRVPEAKQTVGRAESRQQALALLFMSPDFQRR